MSKLSPPALDAAAIIEQISEGFLLLDEELVVRHFNAAAERLLGRSRDDVVGRPLLDAFARPSGSRFEERCRAALATGAPDAFELHVTVDPYRNWYDVRLIPHAQGLSVFFLVTTEERRAAEAEHHSATLFRELFEHMADGVAIYDVVDGGRDFTFKDLNPAGARTGGTPRAEVVGRSVLETYPGVREFGLFEVLQAVARTGVPRHHPVAAYRDRRIERWFENYVFRLPSGEVVAVYEDVTDRRRMEDALRDVNRELEQRVAARTADLEQANSELTAFASSVSHDLRAPLRAVTGFAEIIGRRYRSSLEPQAQHYFDNIVEAGERMGELIDDLLSYSRLGRAAFELEVVELSQLLPQVLADLELKVAASGARLVTPERPPAVLGTPTFVRQLLINLIDNALTFRKVEGEHRVEISAAVEAGGVVVRVADNGIGIAPEHQAKIFNIFQRLHPRDQYPGTGVGLAIARKTAALLGGTLEVDSAPGRGSEFTVRLKAPASPSQPKP